MNMVLINGLAFSSFCIGLSGDDLSKLLNDKKSKPLSDLLDEV